MKRDNAASAMFEGDENYWWITGGLNGEAELNSSEILNANDNSFSMGIDIPIPMSHHNQVNINNTHMALLGSLSEEVYLFDR